MISLICIFLSALLISCNPSSKKASVIVSDVGQHQMWAAQSLELNKNQRFLTSGGMGSMGFGLPASIGAAFANNPSPVVANFPRII